jgi:hypothetical protein
MELCRTKNNVLCQYGKPDKNPITLVFIGRTDMSEKIVKNLIDVLLFRNLSEQEIHV